MNRRRTFAVALPGRGWLLVDACKVGLEVPLLRIVERHRVATEPVSMILSHPHDDHASGFAEAVEVLQPESIVLTSKSPLGPHLLACAQHWLHGGGPTSARLRERGVVSALRAIEAWETRHSRNVSCVLAGSSLEIAPESPARVRICAPREGPHLTRVLDELAAGPTRRGRSPIATGWDTVMTDHPELVAHAFLEIAHHGSAEAHHPLLMATTASPRVWCCTPYRDGLPEHTEALPAMLAANPTLHLTHEPSSWVVPAHDGTVLAADIASRREAEPLGDPFADAADDIKPRPPRDASAPCWAFTFDDASSLRSLRRGASAFAIVR